MDHTPGGGAIMITSGEASTRAKQVLMEGTQDITLLIDSLKVASMHGANGYVLRASPVSQR